MTNTLWVLACLGTINTHTVELEVWSGHKWLSQCHVETTVRGFDHPEQQCFCVERKDDDDN